MHELRLTNSFNIHTSCSIKYADKKLSTYNQKPRHVLKYLSHYNEWLCYVLPSFDLWRKPKFSDRIHISASSKTNTLLLILLPIDITVYVSLYFPY